MKRIDLDERKEAEPDDATPRLATSPRSSSSVISSVYHRSSSTPFISLPFSTTPRANANSTAEKTGDYMARLRKKRRDSTVVVPQILQPNVYVSQRIGSILSRAMILKSDHIPASTENSHLDIHISGAPNYQQIRPFHIHTVGQPTVSGIRTICNMLKVKHNPNRKLQWLCLREEPIVYLNNRPFVLRELDFPFHNMIDFAGIDSSRLADIESRLKNDILQESMSHTENILVHEEHETNEIRSCWESVDTETVQTTKEVFQQLKNEGYNVSLLRLPITAESSFDSKAVDSIVKAFVLSLQPPSLTSTTPQLHLSHSTPNLPLVPTSPTAHNTNTNNEYNHILTFNCQLGRGRSTMGALYTYLLECHFHNATPSMINHKLNQQSTINTESDGLSHYRRGEWDVILKLLRLLSNGKQSKQIVDEAIDICGHVYHLRLSILQSFLKSETARAESTSRVFNSVTSATMKRYFYLICFQSYLMSAPIDLTLDWIKKHSFTLFLKNYPELNQLCNSMIAEDEPLADYLPSTGVTLNDQKLESGRDNELLVDDQSNQVKFTINSANAAHVPPLDECNVLDRVVFNRTGSVLSQRTIIKSEYFVANTQLLKNQLQQGIYMFRYIENLPVSATAQPNVKGIKSIIERLLDERKNKSNNNTNSTRILWLNLREEPVVFINSQPYLLRDYHHPFRVLSEFTTTGMTSVRCEQIENEMKNDVINEWKNSSINSHLDEKIKNRILIHEEVSNRQIKGKYEYIPSFENIQTTSEVFTLIKKEHHLPVTYHRVPFNVNEVPSLQSFDSLFSLLSEQPLVDENGNIKTSVVFSDQKGGRRSTIGMIIACLLLIQQGVLDISVAEEMENENDELVTSIEEEEEEAGTHIEQMGKPASIKSTTTSSSPTTTLNQNSSSPVMSSSPGNSNTKVPLIRRASSISLAVDSKATKETRASSGRGDYKGILSLIRILKQGRLVKEQVDLAIDVCGSVHNLRDAIAECRQRVDTDRTAGVKGEKSGEMIEAVKYMESYAFLIIFNAYLRDRKEKEEEENGVITESQQESLSEKSSSFNSPVSAASPREAEEEVDNKMDKTLVKSLQNYNQFNPYIKTDKEKTLTEAAVKAAADSPESSSLSPFSTDPTLSTIKSRLAFSFPPFSVWVTRRAELRTALDYLRHEPSEALKLSVNVVDEHVASALEGRDGNVLVRGSLLKSDHFKGVINKKIEQIIEGAINFRPIDNFPLAGTGIPTAEGITRILDFYTTSHPNLSCPYIPPFRANELLWLNLREEPILYVNNRPFVLRDGDMPYSNLENTGITPKRVEAMEKQLKRDAIAECAKIGGGERLLLHDEDENGNLFAYYEKIHSDSLKTPKEQFESEMLKATAHLAQSNPPFNFHAKYYRTPITDEQAPSPLALDAMIQHLESGKDSSTRALIMNCQMGRGRTTTALVIASLWCLHRGKIDLIKWSKGNTKQKKDHITAELKEEKLLKPSTSTNEISQNSLLPTSVTQPTHPVVPPSSSTPPLSAGPSPDRGRLSSANSTSSTTQSPSSSNFLTSSGPASINFSPINPTSTPASIPIPISVTNTIDLTNSSSMASQLKAGWYKLIIQLVRVLRDGSSIKSEVDRVIDHCGAFQNLREVVWDTQLLAEEALPRKKPFFVRRGTNYLIRYFFLILIGAYLSDEKKSDYQIPFVKWLNDRSELLNILERIQFPEVSPEERKKRRQNSSIDAAI